MPAVHSYARHMVAGSLSAKPWGQFSIYQEGIREAGIRSPAARPCRDTGGQSGVTADGSLPNCLGYITVSSLPDCPAILETGSVTVGHLRAWVLLDFQSYLGRS